MVRPLVIIHGWSDSSASFRKLAHTLEHELKRKPQQINLADYVSMDDEVTFDDLVAAMMKAWHKRKLSEKPFSVDVIVHSTGGLVIRDWLTRYYSPKTSPVKNLLMLAPANFGSPLAHKGQAFYGRIIKGFRSKKMFQVGKKILQGLELASPYTWHLAMRDRFGKDNFYGPGKILCTVFVGNTGYRGIAAAANENGSDGTVRISTANLNCDFIEADFSQNPLNPQFHRQKSKGITAFGVIPGENHSTIAFKDGGPKNNDTLNYILRALRIDDHSFSTWSRELEKMTQQITGNNLDDKSTHGFQNSVFFVTDQFQQHIKDYFLEFYTDNRHQHWLTGLFYEDVIAKIHAYGEDNSYRNVYSDCTTLYQQLDRKWRNLHLSLIALPEFKRNGNVGYRTFNDEDIGSIKIPREKIKDFFKQNRTLLIKIILRREQAEHLFRLKELV